jgi:hypothetical protein
VFQLTDGAEHDVKPLGINDLLWLVKRLQMPVPELHFVVMIPRGDQVRCVVPKTKGFALHMFSLEVSRDQHFLY